MLDSAKQETTAGQKPKVPEARNFLGLSVISLASEAQAGIGLEKLAK
jgi:hypothetical protein